MDLETAVRERIPILTVLVNNGLMGGYERWIPVASQKYGSRYLSGDYTKVADALGVHAERVTQPSEIVPALRRALAVVEPGHKPGTGCPALVEFHNLRGDHVIQAVVSRESKPLGAPGHDA